MTEIRGQGAADWEDVYQIRTNAAGGLPYLRPDWVKDELARPGEGNWPMVAVVTLAAGPKVVARTDLRPGRGRRAHCAQLRLEGHPDYPEPGRQLLQAAIEVAVKWHNVRRLEATLPVGDTAGVALFESLGFSREARLRQSVRVAGGLVDEWVLARLSGDVAAWAAQGEPTWEQPAPAERRAARPEGLVIRGGGGADWQAFHEIWSQPSVYWGTMQIPYPSADWNRVRIQERPPERFWPLVAEVNGQVVGNAGFQREDMNRAHVGHVGMMVDTDYQGRGVGSALMEAIVDLADNWLGLTRLQLEVYPDNERAVRLYQKFGFEVEGVYRGYAFRDGEYIDTLVMGRLGSAPGGPADRQTEP